MKKPKTPSTEDLALWKNLTNDIHPLPGRQQDKVTLHVPMQIKSQVIQERRNQEYIQARVTVPPFTNDMSGTTSKRLRVKKVVIEGRLDLHGYTQTQALAAIQSFFQRAQLNGWLWVLLITGKGKPDQENTLREQVPKWLNTLPHVSGFAAAKPHDGGHGALYVRLKRKTVAVG